MFDFEEVLNSTNVNLVVKDKDLKFLYCNENVACKLGLDSPNQAIGKNDYDFFEYNASNVYRKADSSVIRGNKLINVRETFSLPNRSIPVLVSKNQFKNRTGEVIGVVISFIDISGVNHELSGDLLKFNQEKQIYEFHIGDQTDFFTQREYDVFKQLLLGLTAKEIAKKLSLSFRTIEDYIEKIKLKLQCTSKHQIPQTAIRLGILHQNIINNSPLP